MAALHTSYYTTEVKQALPISPCFKMNTDLIKNIIIQQQKRNGSIWVDLSTVIDACNNEFSLYVTKKFFIFTPSDGDFSFKNKNIQTLQRLFIK